MKVVIMAGGRGTRISSVACDIPKPMIRVQGKPVLEHEIARLKAQGFLEYIITVSHLSHIIMDYFGDGSRFGVKIEYFVENVPMGNAGALLALKDRLMDDFLLINGDVIFDVDFERMLSFHKKKKGYVTLFTHPNSHPYDSSLIVANKDMSVLRWLAKEDPRPAWYKNRVNAGIHIINPKVLNDFKTEKLKTEVSTVFSSDAVKVDLDRNLLKPLAGTGKMFCYDSPEYVKDMGTPERLFLVEEDFKRGVIQSGNLKNKQKAVFLDRDGTINEYVGFLRDINKFELISGVTEAIKKIHRKGYLCIIITNQPVIARGEVTYSELDAIHNKMETLMGYDGTYIDGLYFCPHHPHKGYRGEVQSLKFECDCRKPKPGMIFQAAEDFNIDLKGSWMIGDGENDVLAGKNAGCKTALIAVGTEENYGQSMTVKSLLEFSVKLK